MVIALYWCIQCTCRALIGGGSMVIACGGVVLVYTVYM